MKMFKGWWPRKTPSIPVQVETGIVDIYGRTVKDALEYFYPRKITGIPVFSVDSIYDHYYPKIKKVVEYSGIGDHRRICDTNVRVIDELFEKVIKNYIGYIHMLPASENHHHSSPGGMIVHSIESSVFSQRYSQEHTPESSGMQDLDRDALPVYRYAAWLAAFMHDAGKVLRDVIVDAVDVYIDGNNTPVGNTHNVPSWQPQKESLVNWAKRCAVATYSVTYIKDRIHNQHNVDSVQLLHPVLGSGYALDYLLSTTAGVHSKLVRVLAGYDNGKDFLSTAVRRGDMLSTSRNVAKTAGSSYLVSETLSPSSKIYKAMQIARQEWTYNEPSANVFVIGGNVYLRYSKTFHSIMRTAKKHELIIPHDIRTVMTIMEDSGIIEPFDANHRSVKFSAGPFNHIEQEDIRSGRRIVQWEEIVKIKWKGLIFGDEPMPDSLGGLFLLSQSALLLEVNEVGQLREILAPQPQDHLVEQVGDEGEVMQTGDSMPHDDSYAEDHEYPQQFTAQHQNIPEGVNDDSAISSVQETTTLEVVHVIADKPTKETSNVNDNLKQLISDNEKKPPKPKKTLNFKNVTPDTQAITDIESQTLTDNTHKSATDNDKISVTDITNKSIQDLVVISPKDIENNKSVIDKRTISSKDVKSQSLIDTNKPSLTDVSQQSLTDKQRLSMQDKGKGSVRDTEKRVISLSDNVPKTIIPELDPLTISQRLRDKKLASKVKGIMGKKGKYISLTDAMLIISITDKKSAIDYLNASGLIKRYNSKSHIVVQKEGSTSVQYIEMYVSKFDLEPVHVGVENGDISKGTHAVPSIGKGKGLEKKKAVKQTVKPRAKKPVVDTSSLVAISQSDKDKVKASVTNKHVQSATNNLARTVIHVKGASLSDKKNNSIK
jgi:hypothetical protein